MGLQSIELKSPMFGARFTHSTEVVDMCRREYIMVETLVDRRYLRCKVEKNNQTFAYVVSES